MPPDRHEPGLLPPYPAARETDIDQRFNGFDSVRVLREAHRPNENAIPGVSQHLRESPHLVAARAALPFEKIPVLFFDICLRLFETDGVPQDEVMIHPSFGNEELEGADQKRQIASGIYGKPLICEFRSK